MLTCVSGVTTMVDVCVDERSFMMSLPYLPSSRSLHSSLLTSITAAPMFKPKSGLIDGLGSFAVASVF